MEKTLRTLEAQVALLSKQTDVFVNSESKQLNMVEDLQRIVSHINVSLSKIKKES